MGQKPLNDQGGPAVRVGVRLPDDLHARLTAAAERQEITISEFLRNTSEAELERIDREIAEAAGVPYVPWRPELEDDVPP
jgi:hypothetical protein